MPLDVHVLNVGRGSCAVLAHPSGRKTMIDINISSSLPDEERALLLAESRLLEASRQEAALVNPITWFGRKFPGEQPFRFILSHPDVDHLLGIANVLIGELAATCVWDLNHTKQLASANSAPTRTGCTGRRTRPGGG